MQDLFRGLTIKDKPQNASSVTRFYYQLYKNFFLSFSLHWINYPSTDLKKINVIIIIEATLFRIFINL